MEPSQNRGQTLGFWGWEIEMRSLTQQIKRKEVDSKQARESLEAKASHHAHKDMKSQTADAWNKWNKWYSHHKVNQKLVRSDKGHSMNKYLKMCKRRKKMETCLQFEK